MKIIRYSSDWKNKWDEFVHTSKNGTFLFKRDYMDYHADRFQDHSLILLDDSDNIVTLLPASAHGRQLRSHGGLTYGGFVMTDSTSGGHPLQWFEAIIPYLRAQGFDSLLYKPVPHIYHRHPAEEDLYALFRHGATLSVRNLSTTIDLPSPIKSSRLGKRAAKRARQSGITVEACADSSLFWEIIVEDRRIRHNVVPVHNAAEIQLLRDRFPDVIRFFLARGCDGEILAGAVIYIINGVLHLQYAAATDKGKQLYAVDIIYHDLIFNRFPDARYFDFGISNEDSGLYLNMGMVAHKEEFGGRSVVYDFYTLDLNRQ